VKTFVSCAFSDPKSPMRVGNYEILETIGTGSFGKVKCN
jgi:hypothetical protein